MRILLTGGSGFVGRQVHKALKGDGHEVRLVLRPGREDRLLVPTDEADILHTDDLFAHSGDWWRETCREIDTVVHAAWYVEPGKFQDASENLACVSGTLALAQGALAAGVGHFVGVGTCMEYRLPSDRLEVTAPLAPSTLYAASKLALYQMLEPFFAPTETAFAWCRLFYLYGDGEYPARLVPYLRRQLESGETVKLSAGTQIRDFLDVADAGRMIATVAETGQTGPVNICSGVPITIRQLAERIADEYGRRDLLEFGTAAIHPSDPASVVGVPNVARR
ncbi:NAD-dependent epimerase/dehydratase family protein [Rhizobium halophytocola]|uniref:dTDP-6-deoxy-L-talose 4-dehydrogenase (NAD+) n=1 Tax=Rhizobium halophytocola TaxID=735519 RepID=A0ABS4E0Q5_9HYPH|nr:NAD(P)-dependent oxidoreductase [Rhizobium halophytocola]MBP1851512.1 dTDP-6-deoxy-L-talose 4-dehydrogenase (NAD+) [Rhizobium halophytocola]